MSDEAVIETFTDLRRRFAMGLVAVIVGAGLGGCAAGEDVGRIEDATVTTTVISHPTTREITVYAPSENGGWPVVFAFHGLYPSQADDFRPFAQELASRRVVVIVPDWRATEREYWHQDGECAYRFGRSIAEEYGGDLDQPVAFVGWSIGAELVLWGGLAHATDGPDGAYDACFEGAVRPDVVVPVSGCFYEYEDRQFSFDFPPKTSDDSKIIVVTGTEDDVCASWQSRDGAAELVDAGYTVELVEIEGHRSVIFRDGSTVAADHPGMELVEAILKAINERRN